MRAASELGIDQGGVMMLGLHQPVERLHGGRVAIFGVAQPERIVREVEGGAKIGIEGQIEFLVHLFQELLGALQTLLNGVDAPEQDDKSHRRDAQIKHADSRATGQKSHEFGCRTLEGAQVTQEGHDAPCGDLAEHAANAFQSPAIKALCQEVRYG